MPHEKPNRTRLGIPNRDYVEATVILSRCPSCGSTRRTKYFRRDVIPAIGTDRNGHRYTQVVFRYCRCLACDTYRRDVFYESQ
jgi:hypothetical protein